MVGVLSNKIGREKLKPGDHIYSWRSFYLYAHHGIYVGDENVIHFTPGAGHEIGTGTSLDRFIFSSSPTNPSGTPCPVCGDRSKAEGVISSCLECFLGGGDLYQFQYSVSWPMFLARARGGTCTLAESDPPESVIHRAELLLDNGFGSYHLFKNNCEDFAIYCKTGAILFTTVSGQATGAVAALVAFVSSVGLTAVVGGIYCISRYVTDVGVRRDVVKVPVEKLVARTSVSNESPQQPKLSPQG